jgi:hypothetical protein
MLIVSSEVRLLMSFHGHASAQAARAPGAASINKSTARWPLPAGKSTANSPPMVADLSPARFPTIQTSAFPVTPPKTSRPPDFFAEETGSN